MELFYVFKSNMEGKVKNLSLFFPAYNEAGNIKRTVEKATPVLKEVAYQYEIIVIDDGSIDGTDTVVRQLIRKNPALKLIRHEKNFGYGAALISGFKDSQYDLVVFNDGDGQFDFSEIKKFLPSIKNNDLVIGYRKKRADPFFRILIQFLLQIWALGFFGLKFKDIDCGFKLIKKEALKKIWPLKSQGAMISTEILYKAKKFGLKIGEVPVSHYPRKIGKQTGGNLRVILKAVKETIDLKKE